MSWSGFLLEERSREIPTLRILIFALNVKGRVALVVSSQDGLKLIKKAVACERTFLLTHV
jgi:hypothetical protein